MKGVLLALETTGGATSVAVFRDGVFEGERNAAGERSHGRPIAALIADALGAIRASRADAVAASCGPGSYTGIRIGMSCALGLGLGWGARLVAVPTLEAWAEAAPEGWDGPIVALRPLGREAVVAQTFSGEGKAVSGPRRLEKEAAKALFGRGPTLFLGEVPWPELMVPGSLVAEPGGAKDVGAWAVRHEEATHGLGFLPIYLRPPAGGQGGTA